MSGYERIKPGVEVVCALVKKDFKTVSGEIRISNC
ncbi:hypothetical protein T4C_4508 [Trichinella pseudospiralis]|uniref:Uncharacterized protein n=1 Tax=Trichinella pseudospiralis TaxID=6337 RepID=A0A0V1GAP6_TRIPS|nr:hypothetical protein T4C_4508 [Trichinella pseudospiralis]